MEGMAVDENMAMCKQNNITENWGTIKAITNQKIKTLSGEHLFSLRHLSQHPLTLPTIQTHLTCRPISTVNNPLVLTKISLHTKMASNPTKLTATMPTINQIAPQWPLTSTKSLIWTTLKALLIRLIPFPGLLPSITTTMLILTPRLNEAQTKMCTP